MPLYDISKPYQMELPFPPEPRPKHIPLKARGKIVQHMLEIQQEISRLAKELDRLAHILRSAD